MPLADCGFPDAEGVAGRDLLQAHGPTLYIDIGFDAAYDPSVANIPQPSMQQIPALVDTGASQSCVDDALARQLGLPLVDRQPMGALAGEYVANVYMAQAFVPVFGTTHYGRLIGVEMAKTGFQQKALLGRDFLREHIMIYDGIRGQVTLAR